MSYAVRLTKDASTPPPEGARAFFASARQMAFIVACMHAAQTLDQPVFPSFPEWPPSGSSLSSQRAAELRDHFEDGSAIEPAPTADEAALWQAYQANLGAARATRSSEPKLVPAYKFESQDGWYVWPEEAGWISAALKVLLDDDEELDFLREDVLELDDEAFASFLGQLRDWVDLNEEAARGGGYVVD